MSREVEKRNYPRQSILGKEKERREKGEFPFPPFSGVSKRLAKDTSNSLEPCH